MFGNLLVNAGMLIAFLSICNQLYKNTGLNLRSPLKDKLISGIIYGSLGIVLIIYSVDVKPALHIDFRNIAITLSAFYGGGISVFVSCIIIAVFRVTYYGISDSSIAGAVITVIISFCSGFIFMSSIKRWKKWFYSMLLALSVTSVVLIAFIDSPEVLVNVMLYYWIGSSLVAFLVFRYVLYLESFSKLFRRLKEEATKDFLTGLNNVRQFDKLYNSALSNAKIKNEKLSILIIDIDFFKKVNDTYGHIEGDYVLKELGKILMDNCRSFDIISRNGGEEFSVILLDCTPVRAMEVAERIRAAVESHSFKLPNGEVLKITVSVGVTSYPDITKDPEKLKENADMALYNAKRTGRNRVMLAEH